MAAFVYDNGNINSTTCGSLASPIYKIYRISTNVTNTTETNVNFVPYNAASSDDYLYTTKTKSQPIHINRINREERRARLCGKLSTPYNSSTPVMVIQKDIQFKHSKWRHHRESKRVANETV